METAVLPPCIASSEETNVATAKVINARLMLCIRGRCSDCFGRTSRDDQANPAGDESQDQGWVQQRNRIISQKMPYGSVGTRLSEERQEHQPICRKLRRVGAVENHRHDGRRKKGETEHASDGRTMGFLSRFFEQRIASILKQGGKGRLSRRPAGRRVAASIVRNYRGRRRSPQRFDIAVGLANYEQGAMLEARKASLWRASRLSRCPCSSCVEYRGGDNSHDDVYQQCQETDIDQICAATE